MSWNMSDVCGGISVCVCVHTCVRACVSVCMYRTCLYNDRLTYQRTTHVVLVYG